VLVLLIIHAIVVLNSLCIQIEQRVYRFQVEVALVHLKLVVQHGLRELLRQLLVGVGARTACSVVGNVLGCHMLFMSSLFIDTRSISKCCSTWAWSLLMLLRPDFLLTLTTLAQFIKSRRRFLVFPFAWLLSSPLRSVLSLLIRHLAAFSVVLFSGRSRASVGCLNCSDLRFRLFSLLC